MTSPTPISPPGATPTPSPERYICLTPSPTSSPSPATTAAPRRASSVIARRRPSDIRESSENRCATKGALHHRLVPSGRASGCKGARELVELPPHGWIAGFRRFRALAVDARARLFRSQGAGYGRPMGPRQQRNRCGADAGRATSIAHTSPGHWLRVAVDIPSLELLQAKTNFEEILASRGLETVSLQEYFSGRWWNLHLRGARAPRICSDVQRSQWLWGPQRCG